MTAEIRIQSDLDALSMEAGWVVAERIVTRVSQTGVFAISLAGGRTPIALYRSLAHLGLGVEGHTASPEDCPAAGVRSLTGKTVWWVDVAAAEGLRLTSA